MTRTFNLGNVKGPKGDPGTNGQDGYSPSVSVTEITGGHRIVITDTDGEHTFDVMDGNAGSHGDLSGRDESNQHPMSAISGLVSALADKASSSDIPTKISDLTDDSGHYTKPASGIPKTDLASAVQTSLGKADSSLQAETDPVFSASPVADITAEDVLSWDGKSVVSVSSTGTSTSEVGYITIDGVEKKLAGGGGGEPSAYIKSAAVSQDGNILTLTKKDDSTVQFAPSGSGGTSDHRQLIGRDAADQHPMSAITGLSSALADKADASDIPTKVSDLTDDSGHYTLPAGGIPKADLTSAVQTSLGKADSAIQSLSGYATETYVDTAVSAVQGDVDDIEAVIPQQASSSNQLADKDFVNSSIENVAAYFITKDAAGNPFNTKAELDAATTYYSGGVTRVPTRNDYTVVLADESKGNAYPSYASFTVTAQYVGYYVVSSGTKQLVTADNKDNLNIVAGTTVAYIDIPTTRYIYGTNSWAFQYVVNNNGLTAAQWAAVNSQVSASKVSDYDSHLTNSMVHVTGENKTNWNGKYSKPSGGIPATHLSSAVQTSLGKADTALQTHQDISGKVDKNNAITGATKCKITYDAKGLVTGGSDLAASDIPSLDTSKITSGTLADERIASASTWNGKSVVSVSNTGTATDEVAYITINGVEKKLAGGGGGSSGATYTATIPSTSWTQSGDYYTKTVTVTGLKASYAVAPVVDCSLSGTDADGDNAILAAFGGISIIDTGANSITCKAVAAPDVNVPIVISVWE